MTFGREDLNRLEALYDKASAVVAMEDVADGLTDRNAIGVRHDVDDNERLESFNTALAMAEWEHARGYRSTYFLLHHSYYWRKPWFAGGVTRLLELGHEVGLHLNAITEAIKTGKDPHDVTARAVTELRELGAEVRGVVAHGDPACHQHGFVNDELFTESARPSYGAPDRVVGGLKLEPVSRAVFGFDYDPNWLPRGFYLSDSGGQWSSPFDKAAAAFPGKGQLHMLVHPDWWGEAFAPERIAA